MRYIFMFVLIPALVLPAAPALAAGAHSGGWFTQSLTSDTVNVTVAAKWNMISVPLQPADLHVDSLFPDAVSNAFAYDAGYTSEDPMETGRGYWLKFAAAGTIPLYGTAVHRDTIAVVEGWNMIGSISDPVAVGDISVLPPGMTLSTVFGYNAGYTAAPAVEPGKAYWVKASSAGSLILDGTILRKAPAPFDFGGLNRLEIEDARGMKQALYLGAYRDRFAALDAEMPPPPPGGIFDARYAGGNWLEFYDGTGARDYAVTLQSAHYPVTLRWEVDGGETRALSLNGGRALAGKGSVVLREEGPVTIRVEGSTVPGRFDLSQNYPNPFNPVTRISYELPVDVHVKLVLYDLLGREVRVLADGVETAGSRTVELDASALPTGVYFYRIQAGDFTATRKMLLMR